MLDQREEHIQCDVAVVGAGPGGATTAYWLAWAGADVLLLDKAYFPRNKPCGDGLTPRAVAMLAEMNLAETVLAQAWCFRGVRIFASHGPPTCFSFHPDATRQPRLGLVMPRHDLDNLLCRQAIATGARFLPGVSALEPYEHQGRLAGLQGQCDGKRLNITAPLIVIATGANRMLLQALGLVAETPPSGLALRAYVTDLPAHDDHLDIYVDRDLLPGYAWVFPTDKHSANVGVGLSLNGMPTAARSRQLRAAFDHLLQSKRLAGGKLLGQPQGYPLRTDFPAIATSAAGVLVVGEAAGLVDPITGEGIALALESGQLAAKVASAALQAGDFSGSRLRQYDELLRDKYGGYFADTGELMMRLSHPQVLEAVAQTARTDARVASAFEAAIMDEQPRTSIVLLEKLLQGESRYSSAYSVFTLNGYRPLLERCRAYMLAQVRLDAPSSAILKLIERGKMLRALLVFLGCQVASGDPTQVIAAAAGIELVHAASLVHDDIMDDAQTRRGLPTLHTTLGTARAIVCGDYLIAKSFRLLAESRNTNPAHCVVQAFIIGAESGILTCAGQFQDVGTWDEENFNEENYHQRIANKTAAAIAGALMAGAALAGGDQALIETLSCYGNGVGRAFQIRDDVLDLLDLPATGCPIDRRPSLPLMHAFEHCTAGGRQLIRQFLAGQPVDGSEITKLLAETGSLTHANTVAESLSQAAIQQVTVLPHSQSALAAFAHYVITRGE